MSEPVKGILVTHADMGIAMLEAVEQIAGTRGELTTLTNRDTTPETLALTLKEQVGAGPVIVFVDLPSGSCAQAARKLRLQRPDIAIVCGFNLPLLLDFVFHRDLPLHEIMDRLRSHVGITFEHPDDGDSPLSR